MRKEKWEPPKEQNEVVIKMQVSLIENPLSFSYHLWKKGAVVLLYIKIIQKNPKHTAQIKNTDDCPGLQAVPNQ